MIANLSNPAGIILYGMYHESAEAMAALGDAMTGDAAWQAHLSDTSSFGVNEIIRQSGWGILD